MVLHVVEIMNGGREKEMKEGRLTPGSAHSCLVMSVKSHSLLSAASQNPPSEKFPPHVLTALLFRSVAAQGQGRLRLNPMAASSHTSSTSNSSERATESIKVVSSEHPSVCGVGGWVGEREREIEEQ